MTRGSLTGYFMRWMSRTRSTAHSLRKTIAFARLILTLRTKKVLMSLENVQYTSARHGRCAMVLTRWVTTNCGTIVTNQKRVTKFVRLPSAHDHHERCGTHTRVYTASVSATGSIRARTQREACRSASSVSTKAFVVIVEREPSASTLKIFQPSMMTL